MDWAPMLAYLTGTVDQELLARNEYLAAENRILKAQLNGQLKLSDAERGALGAIGHRLGRKVLADIAFVARPDTIPGWYRKLNHRLWVVDLIRYPSVDRLIEVLDTGIIRPAQARFAELLARKAEEVRIKDV